MFQHLRDDDAVRSFSHPNRGLWLSRHVCSLGAAVRAKLEVNPSLTLTAMAERAIDKIPAMGIVSDDESQAASIYNLSARSEIAPTTELSLGATNMW